MFNRFTNKSQETIISAQILAQENGQENIEALHLLAALLQQNEGLIQPVLEQMKIDPNIIEGEAMDIIASLPKTKTGAVDHSNISTVQGTGEVAAVLDRAKKDTEAMQDQYISTEHVLLALISVQSPAKDYY